MKTLWKKYVDDRWAAHKNIIFLLKRFGVPEETLIERDFIPENLPDFAIKWGFSTERGDIDYGTFKRDSQIDIFETEETTFVYAFMSVSKTKNIVLDNISSVVSKTLAVLELKEFPSFLKFILVSSENLISKANEYIRNWNSLYPAAITHFLLSELTFNPLMHFTQPKSVIKLSEKQIEEFVESQIGIKNKSTVIEPNYFENLKNMGRDESCEYIRKVREKILLTLPKIKSSDPFVKWNNFGVGDVLLIHPIYGNPSLQIVAL